MGAAWSGLLAPLESARGPYRVAAVDVMLDEGKPGLFARLFYPTRRGKPNDVDTTEDTRRVWWIEDVEYLNGLAAYSGWVPWRLRAFYWLIGHKRTWALSQAALAERTSSLGKMPVVIFSHGLAGCRTFYSTLCESLASHGMLVCAIEHRDGSACWSFEIVRRDGEQQQQRRPIPMRLLKEGERERPIRQRQLRQRIAECVRAHNFLEQLELGAVSSGNLLLNKDFDWHQFKGRIDMRRVSLCGHSFGGSTVLATAVAAPSEFDRVVILDGWLEPLDEIALSQPLLFVNAQKWQWPDNLARIRRVHGGRLDRPELTIRGGFHQDFTDFALLLPGLLARRFRLSSSDDIGHTHAAICQVAHTFLGRDNAGDAPGAVLELVRGKEQLEHIFQVTNPSDGADDPKAHI